MKFGLIIAKSWVILGLALILVYVWLTRSEGKRAEKYPTAAQADAVFLDFKGAIPQGMSREEVLKRLHDHGWKNDSSDPSTSYVYLSAERPPQHNKGFCSHYDLYVKLIFVENRVSKIEKEERGVDCL